MTAYSLVRLAAEWQAIENDEKATESKKELVRRQVASRTYYACFLLGSKVARALLWFAPTEKISHQGLWKKFRAEGYIDIAEIGFLMRNYRTHADYTEDVEFREHCTEMIDLAIELMEMIAAVLRDGR